MREIMREYQLDGSVICTGCVDPTRTATFEGPQNSAEQLAAVDVFFAAEPDIDENGNVIAAGTWSKFKAFLTGS